MGAIAALEGERRGILDRTAAAVCCISAEDRTSERGRETKSPARGQEWKRAAATSLSLLCVDHLLPVLLLLDLNQSMSLLLLKPPGLLLL